MLGRISNVGLNAENSSESLKEMQELQVSVHQGKIEAESLAKEVEYLRKRHEEEINALKSSFEGHIELLSDLTAKREGLLKEETERVREEFERKLEFLKREMEGERKVKEEKIKEIVASKTAALEQMMAEHKKQLQVWNSLSPFKIKRSS